MQIELNLKGVLILAGVFLLLIGGFAGYHTIQSNSWRAREVALQNELASKDKTIELKEGLYQKSALQVKDLEDLLSGKDAELASLKDQLKKQGAELLTANTLIVKLKKDLKDARDVVVTTPDPTKPGVKQMEIDTQDRMDPFQIVGRAAIDCDSGKGNYSLGLMQRSPIKFSVVVSQDKDGTWRSSATSSTKAFEIDIALAAVNPYMLEEKWYEKIALGVEAGVGTAPGFLGGIGVFYEIGKFEVGPKAWFTAQPQGVWPYFGAQLTWHPFKKVK